MKIKKKKEMIELKSRGIYFKLSLSAGFLSLNCLNTKDIRVNLNAINDLTFSHRPPVL